MRTLFIAALSVAAAGLASPVSAQVPPPLPTSAPLQGARPVSLTKIGVRIPAGTVWAHLQYADTPLPCMDQKVLSWDSESPAALKDSELERLFREEMARAGGSVSGDPTNLFEQDSKSSDLQVGALITQIDATLCAKQTFRDSLFSSDRMVVSGRASVAIEWQIYSSSQARVIARIPTTGSYATKAAIDSGSVLILQRAFTDSVRALVSSEAFRSAVTTPEPLAGAPAPPLSIRFARQAVRTPAEAAGSVAVVFAGTGMGSAFLVSPDGYLLTNRHVVGDADRVRIRWADKTESVGVVVKSDRRRDVALIKATGKVPALVLRHGPVAVGESVFAVGTPMDKDLQGTVTKGIISATRMVEGQAFIQSDVGVTHGNSGGPLLDERGAVVGMTVLGLYPDQSKSLNLFIPIDDALKALALKPAV